MGQYKPKNSIASVKFIKWQQLYEREKPFQVFIDPPKDAKDHRTTNLVYEDRDVVFHDVRGQEKNFDLDNQGFAFCHHNLKFEDFENNEAVERDYLPEIERIIKAEVDGADKVFFFDWRLRNSKPAEIGSIIDLNNPSDWLRPSIHAHVDQAPNAVLKRVLLQLPDEAETLLKGRIRVINAWRPLKIPVKDWPLAVCDGSKVSSELLVETDHVRRLYTGSNLNLQYRPGFDWYYLNQQSKDEVLLIKNFDSSSSVNAKYCPHVSFKCDDAPGDAIRESIEVRALVFTTTGIAAH